MSGRGRSRAATCGQQQPGDGGAAGQAPTLEHTCTMAESTRPHQLAARLCARSGTRAASVFAHIGEPPLAGQNPPMLYRRGPRPRRLVLQSLPRRGRLRSSASPRAFPGSWSTPSSTREASRGSVGHPVRAPARGSAALLVRAPARGSTGVVDATSWGDAPLDSTGWVDGAQVESSTEAAAVPDSETDAPSDAVPVVSTDAADEGE